MRRNVLIFHAGALGDFVLTWPLAMALGRLHPQSRIIYVVSAGKGALAEKALGVEWTDGEAGWHRLYESDAAAPPGAKMLAESHSIYTFVAASGAAANDASSPGDVWMNNIRRWAPGAKVVALEARPPDGYGGLWGEFLIDQLASMPAMAESVRQMMVAVNQRGVRSGQCGPSNEARATGDVVIHGGAGSPRKCWPVERYIELARRIKDQLGRSVRFVIGEVEQETWNRTKIESLATAGSIVGPATYVELMTTLSKAAGYVGNDSGPTHLAGIIGVATVALFGPTDAAVWRPLGPRVECIGGWPMETIGVDAVFQKVSELLER